MQWDQPAKGKDEAGVDQLFGFAMTAGNFDKIEIHRVKGLGSDGKRREHWNKDIPAQKYKNVVYLSETLAGFLPRSTSRALKSRVKKSPL